MKFEGLQGAKAIIQEQYVELKNDLLPKYGQILRILYRCWRLPPLGPLVQRLMAFPSKTQDFGLNELEMSMLTQFWPVSMHD